MRLIRTIHIVIFIVFSVVSVVSVAAAQSTEASDGLGETKLFPRALIRMPENEYAIIVEKGTQTLSVWTRDAGAGEDGLNRVFHVPCSTGQSAGPKAKAGDKKTPEGVYFLTDEFEDKYLTPVYGKKAFPSDYPNFLDRRLGRQGSAIWIHGTNKILKPMDSNGCIALENKNVMALSDYIHLGATPLIIVEKMKLKVADTMARERKEIDIFIAGWAQSLETGSYHDYLAHYDAGYLPDIAWWESWLGLRTAARAGKNPFSVQLDNTGIYAQGNVVVVLMEMYLVMNKDKQYLGKRQLFIDNSTASRRIVGDFFQKKAVPYDGDRAVVVAAAAAMVRKNTAEDTVEK